MTYFTLTVFIILFLIAISFQIAKRKTLNSLINSIHKKDYKKTVQLADKPLSRKLLTAYICDLYKARAYYLAGDESVFKNQIDVMLESTYSDDNKKNFFDIYYHVFLHRNDKEYTDKFLANIKATNDAKYIKFNEQAYEVMMNKRSDLIELMDAELETDKYSGFPLGVVIYMIAIQYEAIEDRKNALIYFNTSLTCFPPNSFYASLAKKKVDELSEENEIVK